MAAKEIDKLPMTLTMIRNIQINTKAVTALRVVLISLCLLFYDRALLLYFQKARLASGGRSLNPQGVVFPHHSFAMSC